MMAPTLHTYDLSPRVMAFSTTRVGGSPLSLCGGFNIGNASEEHPEARHACITSLCESLSIDEQHLVFPHQTHGCEVRRVADDFFTLTSHTRQMLLEGVDALSTDLSGVCIGVNTADCVPVLLYDTVHHAAAAIHAGWRGTVQRIVQSVIRHMHEQYATQPAQLCAVIGPSISPARFEVGDEVYQAFAEGGFPMEQIAHRQEKWHIDLWRSNSFLLTEAGVLPENIHTSGICTYDHVDSFFSARRETIHTGRIFTAIMLR
ncbi:MAG: peptidoglycan editing factor PgeF [Prevotella sp.]|nr:peptidoglycan editing factor PgeF [Prevotella sp.]